MRLRLHAALMTSLCMLLVGCTGSSKSGDVLAVYSSTANAGQTGRFKPAGAWDLEYSFNCSRERSEGVPGAKGLALTVHNSDDDSLAFENPQANSGAFQGKGVLHFKESGDYYVGMQTRCDWDVSIVNRA